jgi:hypothetical protein
MTYTTTPNQAGDPERDEKFKMMEIWVTNSGESNGLDDKCQGCGILHDGANDTK